MTSTESEHFYRIISLLMDVSSDVLRHQFLDCVTQSGDGSTEAFLYNNQFKLTQLQKKRVLRQEQMILLSPNSSGVAEINSWDLSLISILMRNLCSTIAAPPILIEVDALTSIRNTVYGHTASAALSDADFGSYWMKIDASINVLLQGVDADYGKKVQDRIRCVKDGPLEVGSTVRLLRDWYSQNKKIDVKLDDVTDKLDQLAIDVKALSQPQKPPANPVLEKMKKQTVLQIQDLSATPFIPSGQFQQASDSLDKEGVVILVAGPGDGKTMSGVNLMTSRNSLDRCIILQDASQWEHVDSANVDAVLLDDIFGRHYFNSAKFESWRPVLDLVHASIKSRDLEVIVTSRTECLSECLTELTRYEMFRHKITCTSSKLTNQERVSILKTVLNSYDKDMVLSDPEIEACSQRYALPFAFPMSCKAFALDTKQLAHSSFFSHPYRVVRTILSTMKSASLVALLFLFYKKGLCSDGTLRHRRGGENTEDLSLLSFINNCMETGVADVTLPVMKKQFDHMTGTFIKHENKTYSFFSEVLYDLIGFYHGEKYPDEVIDVCTTSFLCKHVSVQNEDNQESAFELCVDDSYYENLAERLTAEVMRRDIEPGIITHNAFQDSSFCKVLVDWLTSKDQVRDFLCDSDSGTFLVPFIECNSDSCVLIESLAQELKCDHHQERREIQNGRTLLIGSNSAKTDDNSTKTDASSTKTDDSSTKTDNSSTKKDDSSTKPGVSSTKTDNSSTKTDDSSTKPDDSSTKTDDNSTRTDASSTKTDDSSTKTDASSTKTDDSSTKTDNSSTKTDNSSTKTDDNSTKTDDSSTKTDNSSTKTDDSSTKTDDNSTKTDDSSTKTDNSSTKTDDSSTKTDDSSTKTDDSSTKTDDSSTRTDNSSTKTDDNSTKTDDNSTKTDNSSTKTDNSSTKTDDSSIKTDDSSTKTDDNSTKTDNSSIKTDNSSTKTDDSSIKTDDSSTKTDDSSTKTGDSSTKTDNSSAKTGENSVKSTSSIMTGNSETTTEEMTNSDLMEKSCWKCDVKSLALATALKKGHGRTTELLKIALD